MDFFDTLMNIDEDILLYIQENIRNATADTIMKAVTHLGDMGIFWIMIIFVLFLSKKYTKTAFIMALTLALGLLITNLILKNSVHRIRPFHAIEELFPLINKPEDWSFPSGHATSSIGCGIAMLRNLPKKYGISGFTIGILIAVSRIYLGVHYTTDVVAGALIGTVSALSSEKIINKADRVIKQKRKSKKSPN
ncbi:MAG: phosphatase PAP2 family protein [Ruminococcus sp.]|nr:phosphatase PAP2 family protein [Oscillospiraceae bacterium]MDY4413478.1 phosphatase PAP2 family protein [Ruminococcus sp.]